MGHFPRSTHVFRFEQGVDGGLLPSVCGGQRFRMGCHEYVYHETQFVLLGINAVAGIVERTIELPRPSPPSSSAAAAAAVIIIIIIAMNHRLRHFDIPPLDPILQQFAPPPTAHQVQRQRAAPVGDGGGFGTGPY